MNQIKFNNKYYHLNSDMQKWCEENVGQGSWSCRTGDMWNIYSMFGTTTYTFINEEDLNRFKLRWEGKLE